MKNPLKRPSALWFPWFFFFWAVQLVGNLSLMDWSNLSERLSAQPIRLIWSCRIAFFGVKTPCQTLGLRSFVLQNEIDRAAATGGMPAGRLNCGDWRAIMNWRVEIVSPLLHYKCSLLTVICNQWAQAFCQSSKIRQAALLPRNRRSHRSGVLCWNREWGCSPWHLLGVVELQREKHPASETQLASVSRICISWLERVATYRRLRSYWHEWNMLTSTKRCFMSQRDCTNSHWSE